MENNRTAGFTLLELLMAMSISMIVILGVGQFMVAATNGYEATDNQINLQIDAQDTVNLVSDYLLEINNIECRTISGDEYYFLYDNVGNMYDTGEGMEYVTRTTADQRVLWLDLSSKKLYLFHCNDQEVDASERLSYEDAVERHIGAQLVAENVDTFSIMQTEADGTSKKFHTLKDLKEHPTLKVSISFKKKRGRGGSSSSAYTYASSNIVVPRNELVAFQ